MIDQPLLTLLLSPVLVPQGLYVRRVTPKLFEPEGERQGRVGSGDPLRLLIIGDSAGAGVGAKHQTEALSGQLVSRLSTQYDIHWRLEANDGNTSADMLCVLQSVDPFDVDIVVVSLGVNDVTKLVNMKDWLNHQSQLRQLLTDRFNAKRIILNAVPPLHQFPALPQPLRWYLGRRAQRFNTALANHVEAHDRVDFVAIEMEDDPSMFAEDGFHPSAKAYGVWADALLGKMGLAANV